MSNKVQYALIGALVSILLGIATWWIGGVNEHMKTVDQLQYRSTYLHGDMPQAPLKPPSEPPSK